MVIFHNHLPCLNKPIVIVHTNFLEGIAIYGKSLYSWLISILVGYHNISITFTIIINIYWLMVYLSLWTIWVRQLGWFIIPNIWTKNPFMFQTINQIISCIFTYIDYPAILMRFWCYIKPGWWFQPFWKILVNWDDYSQYLAK